MSRLGKILEVGDLMGYLGWRSRLPRPGWRGIRAGQKKAPIGRGYLGRRGCRKQRRGKSRS